MSEEFDVVKQCSQVEDGHRDDQKHRRGDGGLRKCEWTRYKAGGKINAGGC